MSSATKKGTGDANAPAEKSKFAQTCNRLSLFLKEKGNLRDVSFEINAKLAAAAADPPPPKDVSEEEPYPAKATTVDFLSNMNGRAQKSENTNVVPPKYVILDSSSELEDDSTHMTVSGGSCSKTTTGQITIFYQGKVMVVDDVPEDRARYVMLVAKNGVPAPAPAPSAPSQHPQLNGENKDSDLPIARRASLNKFLAKRKDRATVRAAPYHQLHDSSPPPAAGASSSSGKGHTFDLNK